MSHLGFSPLKSFRMLRCHKVWPSAALKAGQVAILGQHVNAVLVDGGGASWTGPAAMFQSIPQGCCPEGPATAFLEAKKSAVVVEGALDEDSASLDGDAPIAFSQVGSGPDQRGTVGRPLPEQSGFGGKAGSFRSPPLGATAPRKSRCGSSCLVGGRCTWLQEAKKIAVASSAAVGSSLWLMAILLSLKMAALYTFGSGLGPTQFGAAGRFAPPAELKQAGPCPEGRIIRGKRPVNEDEPRMDTNKHK